MTYLEQRNPRIHSSDTNVMKLAHKKIEKRVEHLRIQHLQGANLLYITQMNNSWMIQMKRPPLYI